jgi:hypothetical protein
LRRAPLERKPSYIVLEEDPEMYAMAGMELVPVLGRIVSTIALSFVFLV